MDNRGGSFFLTTALVPLFNLFVGHSKVVGDQLFIIRGWVVGMVSKQPLKGANLLRMINSFSFVSTSNLSITQPATNLLSRKASLSSEMGDIFFFFRTAITNFSGGVVTLQSVPLFLREVNSRLAFFTS